MPLVQVNGQVTLQGAASPGAASQLAGTLIDCRLHFLLPDEQGRPAPLQMPGDATVCDVLRQIEILTRVSRWTFVHSEVALHLDEPREL